MAFTIGFSSLNCGFGIHLLMVLCGAYGGSAEQAVRDYGVSLFLGSLAMLVTALRDILKLFRLDTRLLLLRQWLHSIRRGSGTRILVCY